MKDQQLFLVMFYGEAFPFTYTSKEEAHARIVSELNTIRDMANDKSPEVAVPGQVSPRYSKTMDFIRTGLLQGINSKLHVYWYSHGELQSSFFHIENEEGWRLNGEKSVLAITPDTYKIMTVDEYFASKAKS